MGFLYASFYMFTGCNDFKGIKQFGWQKRGTIELLGELINPLSKVLNTINVITIAGL